MIPGFRIDPEFHGPTLCELAPILDQLPKDDPLEVRWEGYPLDFVWLERAKQHQFVLVVPDRDTQEKTLWKLDLALKIDPDELSQVQKALFNLANQHEWRKRIADQGVVARGTMLLCRAVADILRQGKRMRPGNAAVARECLLERQHPADADVLVRLRNRNR